MGFLIALCVVMWIECGIAGGILWFQWFQLAFPLIAEQDRKSDMLSSCFVALGGPVTLFVTGLDWIIQNPHEYAAERGWTR